MNGIKYRNPEEMKDSGIEWIGMMPRDWSVKRLKHVARCLDERRIPLSSEQRGDVQGKYPYWGANGIVDYIDKYLLDEEVILLGEDGAPFFDKYKNVAFVSNEKIWVNNHIHILKPQAINTIFLSNCLNVVNYRAYVEGSTRDKLTQSSMKDIFIQTPNQIEQKKIANFLDIKAAQFDSIIAKKELLIRKLEEAKKSLISEVVTGKVKIINGEIVPRQPEEMKDSGVEWLGMIPKEWEIKPLKSIFIENKKKNTRGKENNVLSLSYGNIIRRNVENNFGLLPAAFDTYQIVKPNNLIFRLTDLQNDKRSLRVGLVKETGTITSAYLGLINKTSNCDEYLYYLYHTYDLLKVYYNMGGGLRQSSSFEDMKKLPTLLPPLQEQLLIKDLLHNRIANIDSVTNKTTILVERIKQAKQSLISEAVTGKLDLRDWEIIEEGEVQ